MNGMNVDGSKVIGFKLMVVVQFIGLSFQKDDCVFVRYNELIGNYDVVIVGDGVYLDGFVEYCRGWGYRYIVCFNDVFIQLVLVFVVGYDIYFIVESGGDMLIINFNSNFGNIVLRFVGFKVQVFLKDKVGEIIYIVLFKVFQVIFIIVIGIFGEFLIILVNDGLIEGVIEGIVVSGDGIGFGVIVGFVNRSIRVVILI